MTVLDEAAKIVDGGERSGLYGMPEDEFPRIATLWSALLGITVSPQQVCLCMIAGKLMRLAATSTHRDSIVDIAGYARILERLK